MTTSLHELFASDIKPRTRFVEHFSGDALDTLRWEAYGQGTETISMTDDGLSLQGGSNDNDSAGIGFGGTIGGTQTMRPFNCRGSKIIFIQKFSANGEYQASESGFDKQLRPDAFGGVASGAGLITSHHNTNSKWVLRTANGSDYSGSTYVTTSSMDTDWHIFSVECKPSSAVLTIDGVTEATSTTYLPIENMGVSFGLQSEGSADGQTWIRYCEAYNT